MRENQEAGRATMADAEAAFREAFPVALAMGRHAGLDEVEQQEVVQRLGLVLVEKVSEFDAAKGSWRTWGLGIARILVLDAQRRVRTEAARLSTHVPVSRLPAPSLTPEQSLRAREALAIVRASIGPEHRGVFELHALGCTALEIGALLDLPPTTVAWRLKEARQDLERALARMREDRSRAARVRGVVWPFASVTELSRALRGGGEDAAPPAPPVRSSLRRSPLFLGWSGASSRVVLVSLATCFLLSVHLVRILPVELSASRALVTERLAAESDLEKRPDANAVRDAAGHAKDSNARGRLGADGVFGVHS